MDTFLDFAYFSSIYKKEETAWKQGNPISSEPQMLWNLLSKFCKVLIKMKQLKSLMTVSLTPKH